jgi:pimeloyl-ACP methyl ester carboxylesterase
MTLPEPHIIAESFFHKIPSPGVGSGSSSRSPSSPWPITIYFITGNPGLISYYHVFLSLLSKNIASSQLACHHGVHIVGHSLAGFELETAAVQNEDGRQIYDLEEQICFVQRRLRGNMWRLRADPTVSKHHHDLDPDAATEAETSKPKVILIGHSVGTYIAMEILRRHRERQSTPSDDGDVEVDFEIAGGIMLFPTVLDIAKSPSGQKLTVY